MSTHKTFPFPKSPMTGSPVPELTSLHAAPQRGDDGDRRYRGNCDGFLIEKLLRYYQPSRVLDPMTGSGTCRDVCRRLGIRCHSFDLNSGLDAADPASYRGLGWFDFIWLHPPYWRMIRYNDDPRCLSSAPDLEAFLQQLSAVLGHCRDVLTPGGKLAVLMGGYSHRGRHLPLAPLTLLCALRLGLWPACTEIIRLQYGNTSSRNAYRSSFIPGLHDTCFVLERSRGRGPDMSGPSL